MTKRDGVTIVPQTPEQVTSELKGGSLLMQMQSNTISHRDIRLAEQSKLLLAIDLSVLSAAERFATLQEARYFVDRLQRVVGTHVGTSISIEKLSLD